MKFLRVEDLSNKKRHVHKLHLLKPYYLENFTFVSALGGATHVLQHARNEAAVPPVSQGVYFQFLSVNQSEHSLIIGGTTSYTQ